MTAGSPEPDGPGAPAGRRSAVRLGVLGLAVVVAVVGVGLVVGGREADRDPLVAARDEAADEDGFDTGIEAGETLARVAEHLNDAIRACDRDREGPTCKALGAASGYVQVLAAHVVRCTAPGRFEARVSTLAVLDALAARAPDDPPPTLPTLPDCGA